MDYSEKWGKDVDEAVRLALEDLGLTEDQVMVTVLEEPAKGFLGLGSKLAKVRVEKITDVEGPVPSVDGNKKKTPGVTRDLRKKNKQGGGQSSGGGSGGGRGGSGRGGSGGGRDRDRDRDRGGRGRDRDRGHGRSDDHHRQRNSHRHKPKDTFDYDTPDTDFEFDLSDKPQFSEKPADLVPVESNEAVDFLKSIISNMALDVEVIASENSECVFIEINGEDAKTVIGKRGQTLDSVQYLTNLVANKDKEEYRRVIIDVEGYRSRRERTLERLASKLAHKTIKSGRSVKLEPMNPYERKVIHATLQKVEGITTRSEGEEPYRRVIIEKE